MVNDGERTYSRPVEKINGGGGNLSKDSMVKAFLDIFKGMLPCLVPNQFVASISVNQKIDKHN